tara:strand:- start:10910 stop:11149 length:240 start_codon:yes stop_codon:yes gene_type:complete
MGSVNFKICGFIYKNWVLKASSQRSFALDHNIEESIVRKIKNTAIKKEGVHYSIPVTTLKKICDSRNLSLSNFFKQLDL